MRKQYEKPQAEKIEFNYTDVVVASGFGNLKDGKTGPSANACYNGKHKGPNACAKDF